MDSDSFNRIVGWSTIGQFFVGVIVLIITIYTSKISFPFTARRIVPYIFSGLTLAIPYYLAFWGSISLATLSPGTADVLVLRATGWAIFLGMVWGIIWAIFIFPRLIPRK